MADTKISDLAALNGADGASSDLAVVVDVSDTSMAATGTDKKMTLADLATAITRLGSLATDGEVSAAISALSAIYQPVDSDLTAIAALSTTSFGRNLLVLADAAAGRTALQLGTAATADTGTGATNVPTITTADARYQPLDSDLTAIAALATTSFGRAFLELADQAAARTALGLAAIASSGSASDLSTGTVATARIGSGSASATVVLRGDSTWGIVPLSDPLSTVASSSTAQTINVASSGVVDLTLTAACALTMSNASAGSAWSVTLILRQDSTGSRTVTWPTDTKWATGAAPTLSTAASAIDVVTLTTVDGGTSWLGFLAGKAFA